MEPNAQKNLTTIEFQHTLLLLPPFFSSHFLVIINVIKTLCRFSLSSSLSCFPFFIPTIALSSDLKCFETGIHFHNQTFGYLSILNGLVFVTCPFIQLPSHFETLKILLLLSVHLQIIFSRRAHERYIAYLRILSSVAFTHKIWLGTKFLDALFLFKIL